MFSEYSDVLHVTMLMKKYVILFISIASIVMKLNFCSFPVELEIPGKKTSYFVEAIGLTLDAETSSIEEGRKQLVIARTDKVYLLVLDVGNNSLTVEPSLVKSLHGIFFIGTFLSFTIFIRTDRCLLSIGILSVLLP